MALINCKECNSEISDKAFDCPKCGAKLRKPERSFFGKIVKYTFIVFNLLMLLWFITGVGSAAQTVDGAASEAEQAGAAIGTGIGAMLIITIWVFGDLILGIMTLLTRPKR
ncbi:hypothetical protein [Flavobacterium pedocola]